MPPRPVRLFNARPPPASTQAMSPRGQTMGHHTYGRMPEDLQLNRFYLKLWSLGFNQPMYEA